MRTTRIFILLSFTLSLIGLQLQAQGRLEDVLDADGRIAPGNSVQGTLEATGWSMSLDPDGTPRFNQLGRSQSEEMSGLVSPAPPIHPDDKYWENLFGSSGVVGKINVVAVSGCNDVYIGGVFQGIGGVVARNIARWDGESWHALGEAGENGVAGPVYAITADGDNIYVGGRFDVAGTQPANNIARWDGTAWHPLGNGVDAYDEFELPTPGTVKAIAVSGSDIYVGGRFDTVGQSIPAANIARWNGSSWGALAGGLQGDGSGQPPDRGEVHTIAIGFGGVCVGGRFVRSGTTDINGLARWNGSAWSPVGGGLEVTSGRVEVFTLEFNGPDLYVGGRFDRVGGADARNIAVWAGMLGRWFPFAQGSRTPVHALAVYGEHIYASGDFTAQGGPTLNNIAFWNGTTWVPLGRQENNGTDTAVSSIAISSNSVYVAGVFGTAGPATAGGIAIWDIATQTWKPLSKNAASGGGIIGVVYAVALTEDFLYVGGRFGTAGLVKTNSLARWHRQTGVWSALGGGIAIDPNISTTLLPSVRAIAVDGNNVYVGGRFDYAGGVRANNVAKWDGIRWSGLGDGIGPNSQGGPYDSTSTIYALAAKDGTLYAGGEFVLAGGERANRVAEWKEGTQTWTALGGGIGGSSFNTRVNALAIGTDGVYVGGVFPVAGEVRASNVARFDGTTWYALGKGVNNAIYALAVDDGGNLYAGGNFSTAGGLDVENVARWNGSIWQPLGEGLNLSVFALTSGPRGVYAAGEFLFSGPELTSRVALWNGTYWEGLGSGLTNQVGHPASFSVAVDGNEVFYGGDFTIAGGESALNVAKWLRPGSTTKEPPTDWTTNQVTSAVASQQGVESRGLGLRLELQPNPVSSTGRFTLYIPERMPVRLTLYNTMGEEVARIHDGTLPVGETVLSWNSEPLPDGLYFYRLTGVSIEQSGRIVISR